MASPEAQQKLAQLKTIVEEIHSRREEGLNGFGRDEPACGRLVRCLDEILGQNVQDMGGAWLFLTTAAQTTKLSSSAAEVITRVEQRRLASMEDSFRLWILFALSTPGAVLETLRLSLVMRDLIDCFYYPSSPLKEPPFVEALIPLVAALFAHPLHGVITYRLDVSCLTLFDQHEEIVTVRRRAATSKRGPSTVAAAVSPASTTTTKVKRGSRGPPSSASETVAGPSAAVAPDGVLVMSDFPTDATLDERPTDASTTPLADGNAATPTAATSHSHHHHQTTTFPTTRAHKHQHPVLTDAVVQTDDVHQRPVTPPPPPPLMVSRDVNTEESKPLAYADLKRLENVLLERERINNEQRKRLDRQQEEVEELREDLHDRLEAVQTALKNLKNLYNHHFMLVKDAQDSNIPIDSARVNVVLPRIMAILNAPNAPSTNELQRGHDSDSDSSTAIVVQSGGATFAASSGASSPCVAPSLTSPAGASGLPRPASFSSDPGGRPRSDSFAQRVLPPPNSAPTVTRGKQPWRTDIFVETERSKQLEAQQHRCPGCRRELPNANNTNFLTKAIQRTQKPRRCHYCGLILCHECHTNKKHSLPFLVIHNWDFTEQHVCNADFDFLCERWTKPLLRLSELPESLVRRPAVAQAATLRRVLSRVYAYLCNCPEARTVFGSRLAHYYFLHEDYYSMSDLQSLRAREDADASRVGGVGRFVALGTQLPDVIAALEVLVAEAKEHVTLHCGTCKAAAVKRCTMCGDAEPVMMFESGVQCPTCGSPFHSYCLALGCPRCEHH